MKKAYLWLLTVFVVIVACQLPSIPVQTSEPATPEPLTAEPVSDKPEPPSGEDEFALFRDGLVSSQQDLLDELAGASVYSIEFTIQDDIVNASGIEEVRYTNRETVPLDEIHFRLLPNVLNGQMRVASVQVNDQPFEPVYELQNSLMRSPVI